MLRALLIGGGVSLALLAVGLMLGGPIQSEAWSFGLYSALASSLAFFGATRFSATASWPVAIVGWIVGFFALPGAIRIAIAIAEILFGS
jgi:hypothetical protein